MSQAMSPKLTIALTILVVMAVCLLAPNALGQSAAPASASVQSTHNAGVYFEQPADLSWIWEQPGSAAKDQLAAGGRTCRCSCGYPCKTNADCGPGGVCTAGISCCGRSSKKGDLFTTKSACGEVRASKK